MLAWWPCCDQLEQHLRESLSNLVDRHREFPQDHLRRNPQHPIPRALERPVPALISRAPPPMPAAIHLRDEPDLRREQIRDVAPEHRHPPAKEHPELPASQGAEEQLLGGGAGMAHLASAASEHGATMRRVTG